MIDKLIETLMERQVRQKEELIKTAIGINDNAILLDLSSVPRRGQRNVFPDGREVFVWDGKPIIEFYPIETSSDGAKMTVTQRYRIYT
jgi:hypothetical protein